MDEHHATNWIMHLPPKQSGGWKYSVAGIYKKSIEGEKPTN
ncbi:hypothetical protein PTHTG4_38510 [Parageobacillus thermoglucosidasius]|nr:hypothetical protein PTHTG4_38510 [Parageobacillus thermoglucosidasius]